MKNWLIILTLVITTAGTFYPCCLIDNCCSDEAASAHDKEQQRDENTCSPFFACDACAVSVEIAAGLQMGEPAFQKPTHQDNRSSFILCDYVRLCWQPPKAG
jgi:hypothetical protein